MHTRIHVYTRRKHEQLKIYNPRYLCHPRFRQKRMHNLTDCATEDCQNRDECRGNRSSPYKSKGFLNLLRLSYTICVSICLSQSPCG